MPTLPLRQKLDGVKDCVAHVNNPTLNNNSMPGATYVDLPGSYNINKNVVAYFKIDNLLNQSPVPSPGTNTGLDVNPALYDTLGRLAGTNESAPQNT